MSSPEQSRDHCGNVRLELSTQSASNAALISLSAAFYSAVAIAAFPERLEADKAAQRLDVLFQYLLREAKSVPIEGIAETDEAAGVRAALAIIEETIRTLRE
jgi:hypothetical protein